MIEWKGLRANTPYSSANSKTQDDAVVGMQDTVYVTGPGYGGYEANVRVHNASGAVVAQIPVCGGGGALSAPAPVRILDDSTTYSYSLEVVRGAVPADDPDKIVIRIIGGASKRYPGQVSTLPDGSISMSGPVNAPNIRRQKSSGVWTPSPNPRYLSAGSAGTTAQIIAKAPHKFNRLKVAFGSTNNGAAYNVTNCALGVTKTPDVMTPSTGGTVTGDGSTGLVSAISAPLAVAQNPGLFVSRVWAPWIPMPAIQADDGFWYWLCRYEFSGIGAAYGQGVAADGWRRDDTGNWWAMKRVTTGANQFFGVDAAAFGPAADATAYQAFAHVVQADFGGCGEGQISVAGFGASTMTAGGDNTGSFIERTNGVCFERGNGISLVGMAQPNATTAQIYDDIVARGLNTEFDVILMPVLSSNDGYTEGLVLKQIMRAMNIRDMAARYGQKVLFVILPHNGAAATPELLAIREKAEAILFASGGVIDLCPLIQGASRYVWDAAWSDDGVHPNLTGRDRLKLLAPDVIIRAVREIVQ